jgi:hypothetical protein
MPYNIIIFIIHYINMLVNRFSRFLRFFACFTNSAQNITIKVTSICKFFVKDLTNRNLTATM